jgi:single-stranded-DNA-specific exonuclease
MAAPWSIPPRDPEAELRLARALGTSPLLAALLRNRGFTDEDSARRHLQPRLTEIEEPGNLAGMEAGAARLSRAIRARERIIIYGDYDVDGMTGTVILLNFIRLAGGRAEAYIPDRRLEGYSFNPAAIAGFLATPEKPGLVVTVDHGTSAHEGIAALRAAGVDVVVTDHHHPPEQLPSGAAAIINPRRPDCPSREKSPCGAAVAFKLAWAAAQSLSGRSRVDAGFREFLVEAMALVALATVTDVVPLVGENRILCFHGLRALGATRNPGLRALLRRSRLDGQAVRAVHIGYRLGPRINAAGRMGIVPEAIELLTTPDEARAEALALRLEAANEERRRIEQEMLAAILELPEIRDFRGGRGICLGREGWHVGVIGIVASRLVDRFQVPVLIAGLDGDRGRGSARARPGIHLARLLDELSEHLEGHGGHAGAAGCTISASRFPALKRAFEEATAHALAAAPPAPPRPVDMEIPFAAVRPEFVQELEMLAPHGAGNPMALFCTRGVSVAGRPRLLGAGQNHLEFFARHGDRTFRAIAFGRADLREALARPGATVDLAYRLKFGSYSAPGTIEIEVEDALPA